MHQITPEEIQFAYELWRQSYRQRDADEKIAPFLQKGIENGSWLKRARQSLQLSAERLAEKIGISRSAYFDFEKNEELGTISLNSMIKCAESMNCELVYAIRPKTRQTFSKIVWSEILKNSGKQIELRKCVDHRKSFALAAIATDNAANAKFRKKQKWTQRASK